MSVHDDVRIYGDSQAPVDGIVKMIGEIRPSSDAILEPGMVLSIEPMIAIKGVDGFKHADMFLVKDDGIEQLTNFDNGVIVLD